MPPQRDKRGKLQNAQARALPIPVDPRIHNGLVIDGRGLSSHPPVNFVRDIEYNSIVGSGTSIKVASEVNKEQPKEIEVHLFTDGGCSGNPGPGGWGFILRHLASGKELEKSGAMALTTNNQMELEAVIQGLSSLRRPCRVELFTDSVYVGKGMTEWMPKWKANGWKRRDGKKLVPVKNEEFWKRLDKQLSLHHVKYTRVAGHSGHEENERVDGLAVAAYQKYL